MTEAEYLLTCLAEECCEVAHRASKALRFGLKEIQPGQSYSNEQRLSAEIRDVYAVVELLEERGVLRSRSLGEIGLAMQVKKDKIEAFMAYSRDLGVLGQ